LKGIESGGKDGCLVFNNLFREGFVMGVPIDQGPYDTFCNALSALIRRIHARGVIHVDLYPSNILWLREDREIKIRVIDWDAATFLGQTYPNSMSLRFERNMQQYYVTEPVAKPENDAWHVFILSSLNLQQRISLHGTSESEASKVNSAYQRCISDMVKDAGGLTTLHDKFLSWFSEMFQPL
jgi:serine/threonine protein kinase